MFKTSISKTTIATLQFVSNNKVLPLIQTKATFQQSKNETRLTKLKNLALKTILTGLFTLPPFFTSKNLVSRWRQFSSAVCVCNACAKKKIRSRLGDSVRALFCISFTLSHVYYLLLWVGLCFRMFSVLEKKLQSRDDYLTLQNKCYHYCFKR